MSTNHQAVTQNLFVRFMMRTRPSGFKRLVFLASLIAFVKDTRDPEATFIRNMNKVLHLSRGGDSSLEFPVRLSRVLWRDRDVLQKDFDVLLTKTSTTEAKKTAAQHIASKTPEWFRYASVEAIAADVSKYFCTIATPA